MVNKVIDDFTPLASPDGTEQVLVDQGAGVYRTVTVQKIGDSGTPIDDRTAKSTLDGTEVLLLDEGSGTYKKVTVDNLLNSLRRKRTVTLEVVAPATALTTGDGKAYWVVPEEMDGMNLVRAHAHVFTASSSGTPTVQVHNLTQTADMLSTEITIDENELDSKDATTPPVIDAANDDVATGDVLRIDVDVAGTSTAGLHVRLEFQA